MSIFNHQESRSEFTINYHILKSDDLSKNVIVQMIFKTTEYRFVTYILDMISKYYSNESVFSSAFIMHSAKSSILEDLSGVTFTFTTTSSAFKKSIIKIYNILLTRSLIKSQKEIVDKCNFSKLEKDLKKCEIYICGKCQKIIANISELSTLILDGILNIKPKVRDNFDYSQLELHSYSIELTKEFKPLSILDIYSVANIIPHPVTVKVDKKSITFVSMVDIKGVVYDTPIPSVSDLKMYLKSARYVSKTLSLPNKEGLEKQAYDKKMEAFKKIYESYKFAYMIILRSHGYTKDKFDFKSTDISENTIEAPTIIKLLNNINM